MVVNIWREKEENAGTSGLVSFTRVYIGKKGRIVSNAERESGYRCMAF